ncbi:USP6 N-terminal-like protein isoform X3 [Oryctolagus cuniculus]|uniref:USP6 N-terminal-like protein isoform X3 n=1 Tax=Oryctolagus cuniculus TaxID=9986 RepID=UPI00387A0032
MPRTGTGGKTGRRRHQHPPFHKLPGDTAGEDAAPGQSPRGQAQTSGGSTSGKVGEDDEALDSVSEQQEDGEPGLQGHPPPNAGEGVVFPAGRGQSEGGESWQIPANEGAGQTLVRAHPPDRCRRPENVPEPRHVPAALWNEEVGYRQGMNWVAAVLLMFLDEEDAFWALTQLMRKPRHAMHGFYKANCAKLVRLQQHHENILKCRLPKLKKHLEDQGVSTAAYTRKWFQQCFVDGVPFSLMLRFFDVYILEGEPMLTAMSYTALKIHRKQALQLSGDNLLEYLQEGLRQAWALRDNSVLRRLKASKTELERCKGLLPPPAKQEEMPRRLLGLELMSLVPRPHPTSQRLRVGCRKDRVGRPVAADWRELPSGLAPRTQGAGHPESNPGFFLGASDLGDTGDLSQGPCLFTTMSLLYTGECGLPGGKPLQGLLGSPKPAQPSLRCSRDSRSRGHPAAQHLPKLDPTVLTPLEPTMEDEECSVEGASP